MGVAEDTEALEMALPVAVQDMHLLHVQGPVPRVQMAVPRLLAGVPAHSTALPLMWCGVQPAHQEVNC
jgi:hypothetical protein